MRIRIGAAALAVAMVASSCGGSADETNESGLGQSEQNESVDNGSDGDVDLDTEGSCSLLSAGEIEELTGRVVIGSLSNSPNGGVAGSCVWDFEPLVGGLFDGDSPQLILSIYESTEFHDQMSEGYPEAGVEGIGSGAISRAPGEIIFSANGSSGQVGLLLVYESGQETEAAATAEALAKLIAGRL